MVDMNKLLTYNTVLLMNPRYGSQRKFHNIISRLTHYQNYRVTLGMNWDYLPKISLIRAVLQIYKVYQQDRLLKKVWLVGNQYFVFSYLAYFYTKVGGGRYHIGNHLTKITLILRWKHRYLILCAWRISGITFIIIAHSQQMFKNTFASKPEVKRLASIS